jgi:hypothetical protein
MIQSIEISHEFRYYSLTGNKIPVQGHKMLKLTASRIIFNSFSSKLLKFHELNPVENTAQNSFQFHYLIIFNYYQ